MAEGKTEKLVVTPEIIQEFLGGIKIRSEGEIAERTQARGRRRRPGLDSVGRRHSVCRSQQHEGQRRFHHHRADSGRDAGIDAGRA